MGAGKAFARFGYGIISHVNPLASLMQSVPRSARPVVEAVAAAQGRHGLFPTPEGDAESGAPVVVGLSGGADSVCLLHVLWLLASLWKLTLHAAHLDHGLRADSREDASLAAATADELGVEFHLRCLARQELSADSRGVEAAARVKRYEFLADVAASVKSPPRPPTIAVAHHMDDQAETVLMNFLRGSGLLGLSGMPWVRTLSSGEPSSEQDNAFPEEFRLVRPLLGVRRSQLIAYLDAYGLTYCEDHTNKDTSRLRNRMRHEILPLLAEVNPQIVDTMARTAYLMGAEADRVDSLDRQALAAVTVEAHSGRRHVLDLEQFGQLSLAAQRGVLRLACEYMNLDIRDVGFEKIEHVIWRLHDSQAATGPHTLSDRTDWTVAAGDEYGPPLLSIHRRDALPVRPQHPHLADVRPGVGLPCPLTCLDVLLATPDWHLRCEYCTMDELPADWREGGHAWRAFLDADRVQTPVLTVPAPGMRFSPLGMAGRHKHLGDFFTDRKTPVAMRSDWPIVVDTSAGEVVWVCGHAIADRARISAATRRVLRLEWLRTQFTAPRHDAQASDDEAYEVAAEKQTHAR